MGSVFELFAEVAGAVGIGGGFAFVDGVDEGGVGVGIEGAPVVFVGREAATVILDVAADDAVGLGILVFVAGVGAPVDGDLVADAEIEREQRRENLGDSLGRRGVPGGVGDGDAGGGAVLGGGVGAVLEALGVVAG